MRLFISILLKSSVTLSVIIILFQTAVVFLRKRYSAAVLYYTWLVIATGLLVPIRPSWKTATSLNLWPVQTMPAVISAWKEPGEKIAEAQIFSHIPVWDIAGYIWLLGVIGSLSYHLIKYDYFMKLVSRWSEAVDNHDILDLFYRLKKEMSVKQPIGLKTCPLISGPMLVGISCPCVLLPEISLKPDQLEMILKHELIHFKRKDLWYKYIILAATAVHWFNPFVFFMAKSISIQNEISCDEKVLEGMNIKNRESYCITIMDMMRRKPALETILSTNFYGGKSNMKKRVVSIMNEKDRRFGIFILITALIGISMIGCSQPKEPDNLIPDAPNPIPQVEMDLSSTDVDLNTEDYMEFYTGDDWHGEPMILINNKENPGTVLFRVTAESGSGKIDYLYQDGTITVPPDQCWVTFYIASSYKNVTLYAKAASEPGTYTLSFGKFQ